MSTTGGTVEVPNRSNEVILLHTILPCFGAVFIGLRLYSRFCLLKAPGWDDLLLTFGWLATVASDTVICMQTNYGLGKHMSNVDPSLYEGFFKLMYCAPLLYVTSHLCIKNAFLSFYLRLTADPRYRRTCFILIAINTSIYIACFIPGAFGCKPITTFWNRALPGGKCINLNALYLANAGLNMTMDLCILSLPVPMIWRNRGLTTRRKLIASFLLLLGVFTCGCSIIRIPNLNKALLDGDITWDAVDSHKWSNIEIHVATMTACIPTIKPLFQTLFTGETIAERNERINRRRASSAKTGSDGGQVVSELDGSNAIHVARKLSVAQTASSIPMPSCSPTAIGTPQRVESYQAPHDGEQIQWGKNPFSGFTETIDDDPKRDYHEVLGLPYGFDTRRRPSILAADPLDEEVGPTEVLDSSD
ncbi:hypothetical protein BJ508DRAFT_329992 [Ascobolus immersus RN42]|uniref:Rhodopsin domain-containing protein n=1 Tax=Ascobolus immersus RN42 TaxID=1160509 RepID=A0A3N4HWN7_ASCIM|nr:hypothetical protein BJ508DRAFT_329992 [Ascobolus immersus RN42]